LAARTQPAERFPDYVLAAVIGAIAAAAFAAAVLWLGPDK
jgi:hypothetical protein